MRRTAQCHRRRPTTASNLTPDNVTLEVLPRGEVEGHSRAAGEAGRFAGLLEPLDSQLRCGIQERNQSSE